MSLWDELHLRHPFAGSRTLRGRLSQAGHSNGRNHFRQLWHDMLRATAYFIGLPDCDGDDAIGVLADRAKVLPCDMAGDATILAVVGVVEHEHTFRRGRNAWIPAQWFLSGRRGRIDVTACFGKEHL